MNLKGVQVGDTVRVQSERYDQPALVVKVGRTLATLSDGHQYDLESGKRKGVVRGWGYTAFTEAALRRRALESDFRGAVEKLYEATRRGPDSLKAVDDETIQSMRGLVDTVYRKLCG